MIAASNIAVRIAHRVIAIVTHGELLLFVGEAPPKAGRWAGLTEPGKKYAIGPSQVRRAELSHAAKSHISPPPATIQE